ncbi:MAG: hypothetical protein R2704_11945 [Microthrixaceae bacterium]
MATDRLVDAHVHVASSSDEDAFPPTHWYRSDWWRNESGVERLHQNPEASCVEGAVVVRRSACTATTAPCGIGDGGRSGVGLVGAIDLSGGDIEADFRTLAQHDHLGGVRLFGVGAANAGVAYQRHGAVGVEPRRRGRLHVGSHDLRGDGLPPCALLDGANA